MTAGITSGTHNDREKVERVSEWVANNFFHYNEYFGFEDYGVDSSWEVFQLPIETIFAERGVGCHLASAVTILMLEAIGIDATYLNEDGGDVSATWGHGVVFIPSINRYIHGDALAIQACLPGYEFLMTQEELATLYTSSPPGIGSFHAYVKDKYRYKVGVERDDDCLFISGCTLVGATDTQIDTLRHVCSEYQPITIYGSDVVGCTSDTDSYVLSECGPWIRLPEK